MAAEENKRKPRCVKGTACGYSCISSKLICSSAVTERHAAAMIKVATGSKSTAQEPDDQKLIKQSKPEELKVSNVAPDPQDEIIAKRRAKIAAYEAAQDAAEASSAEAAEQAASIEPLDLYLDFDKLDSIIVKTAGFKKQYTDMHEQRIKLDRQRRSKKSTDETKQQVGQKIKELDEQVKTMSKEAETENIAAEAMMTEYRNKRLAASGLSKDNADSMVTDLKRQYAFNVNPDIADKTAEAMSEFHMLTGGILDKKVTRIMSLADRAYAYAERGVLDIGKAGGKTTVYHELAHIAEVSIGAQKDSNSWLYDRTDGSDRKLVKLSELTGQAGYEDSEVALTPKVAFASPYVGKYYGSQEAIAKKLEGWDNNSTEVVSMGVEKFASAKSMLELYKADKDHFRYTESFLNKAAAVGKAGRQ